MGMITIFWRPILSVRHDVVVRRDVKVRQEVIVRRKVIARHKDVVRQAVVVGRRVVVRQGFPKLFTGVVGSKRHGGSTTGNIRKHTTGGQRQALTCTYGNALGKGVGKQSADGCEL
jgi:hypothetical protein